MAAQDQPLITEGVHGRIQTLTEVNIELCDKNEHLSTKVGLLESRLSRLTISNSELSSMLVHSEEEKLKLSKELVEEKQRNNKMVEQLEEELLNLKDKLLNQGSVITQIEMERDKLKWELQSGRELSQDYNHLKEDYQSLSQAHHRELAHNQELSTELLALAQAQDALRRQLQEQQQTVQTTTKDLHIELDRVLALVSRMSQDRVKPEDLAALDKEQKTLGANLLGNQDKMKTMMENLKRTYEEKQKELEEKVLAMDKENKMEIQSTQQKLTQQRETKSYSQSYVREIEEENSQLQLKLKELNEEYRARLNCYIQDLAEYMDGIGESTKSPNMSKMKRYVDNMLQDMRSSFRVREEQLATAARFYKKRLQRITITHHALLIAYRDQREQMLAKPDFGLKTGPPESSFDLDINELKGEMEKEIQHLRQDKARLELQLQTAMAQMSTFQIPIQAASQEVSQKCEESWTDVRKQLKDMTESTLESFEKERILLMTRATVAEAQVTEMQEYIDKQLDRYKKNPTDLNKQDCREEAHPSTTLEQRKYLTRPAPATCQQLLCLRRLIGNQEEKVTMRGMHEESSPASS
ncbi:coiled-coil domain-containing protein 78 [Boleophthalmus pectinirostris]|uniref:coiled-coil domain-containing protein 78 n=1 Tax=Boleophthalmus pectinirostris TaxID=150288 RepID=UPI0024320FE6|nr:coiled-coil domain-containing protein 78 [Boleophthalmus pectinirostris]